jgi:hypothetical protein
VPDDPLAAWTNTQPDGTSGGANDCSSWTKSDLTTSGYGSLTEMSSKWTLDMSITCSTALHLYCIEASP